MILWLTFMVFCLVAQGPAYGAITFASYYANSMVLQSEPYKPTIWGYGDGSNIGEEVWVSLFYKKYYTTIQADPSTPLGIWKVTMDPQPVGGPHQIEARDSSNYKITLSDILFGDVWLCSGQSNMEHEVYKIDDAEREIDNAGNYSNVRLFRAAPTWSNESLVDLKGITLQWSRADSASVVDFSAVCWLFGRRISTHFNNRPIGLVGSYHSGTRINVWSSPDVLEKCPLNREEMDSYIKPETDNSLCWNAMIHPLLPLTFRGILWYQGESDRDRNVVYNCRFPTMIKDWRKKLSEKGETSDNIPFGFVQLSPFENNASFFMEYPRLRWAQTASKGFVPNPLMENTFMATAMDLPDFDSPYGRIHPRYKQEIGRRLSISGLTIAYGQSMGRYNGPFPTEFVKKETAIEITYDNGGVELDFRNGNYSYDVCCTPPGVTQCDICSPSCEVSNWRFTTAKLKDSSVITVDTSFCDPSYTVRGVRYLWYESPCLLKQCSVYSTKEENELPVPPFIYDFPE